MRKQLATVVAAALLALVALSSSASAGGGNDFSGVPIPLHVDVQAPEVGSITPGESYSITMVLTNRLQDKDLDYEGWATLGGSVWQFPPDANCDTAYADDTSTAYGHITFCSNQEGGLTTYDFRGLLGPGASMNLVITNTVPSFVTSGGITLTAMFMAPGVSLENFLVQGERQLVGPVPSNAAYAGS